LRPAEQSIGSDCRNADCRSAVPRVPISGTWLCIPFSVLPGTCHHVALDFVIEGVLPGSHEPPAYAVIFLEGDTSIVHLRNFLDTTATFRL
jgi:3',5'-cyclic-AMP phosphodiesterase